MKKFLNEGNQIHNFISSSGSGSDFLTNYGSGSTCQKVRFLRFRFHNTGYNPISCCVLTGRLLPSPCPFCWSVPRSGARPTSRRCGASSSQTFSRCVTRSVSDSLIPDPDPAFQSEYRSGSASWSYLDPGFWWPKIQNNLPVKKIVIYIFLIKNCNLPVPRPPIFVGNFCHPGSGSGLWIPIRIYWPDWIRIQSVSETL